MQGGARRRGAGQVAKFHAPEIVLGPGAFDEVGPATAGLGMRRPLVVSDRCLQQTPWFGMLLERLAGAGLEAASYVDVSPNPRAGEVASADALLGRPWRSRRLVRWRSWVDASSWRTNR